MSSPPDPPQIVTADQLRRILCCDGARAMRFNAPINLALSRFEIDTPDRVAAFLAQIGHESGSLRYVREIWGPTRAQLGYERRADLGNTEPGDGYRYLGRGLIQITGRANYASCGQALGLDLVAHPEILEEPLYASMSAGWYWASRGLNRFADLGDHRQITRRINGGYNGWDDRMAYLGRAQEVLA